MPRKKNIDPKASLKIGKWIRHFRLLNEMTQSDLANILGISFQQLQKYEKGSNQISASMLFAFSKIFKVTINEFNNDLDPALLMPHDGDSSEREMYQLMALFTKIDDAQIRRHIIAVATKAAALSDIAEHHGTSFFSNTADQDMMPTREAAGG